MQREFSVLAEGRHIFGRRPKKSLAPRVSNNMIDQISTGPFYFIIIIFVSIIINFGNFGESVVKRR